MESDSSEVREDSIKVSSNIPGIWYLYFPVGGIITKKEILNKLNEEKKFNKNKT